MNVAKILFIRGLPGSGKSYIADALEKKLGKSAIIKLDPDATDYKSQEYINAVQDMKSQGVDEKLHPYRFLRAQAYQGIERRTLVVWNQAFTNAEIFRKMVNNLTNHADERQIQLKVLVAEVSVKPDLARARIQDRVSKGGHDVPHERFNTFVADYASLDGYGYEIISIDGEQDVEISVEAIISKLSEL